jgi:hypothetical protein
MLPQTYHLCHQNQDSPTTNQTTLLFSKSSEALFIANVQLMIFKMKRIGNRKGTGDPHSLFAPREGQRTPSSRLSRKDEDCFGNEMYKEDFTQVCSFRKLKV